MYLYGHTKRWGPISGIAISFLYITYGIVAGIPAAIAVNTAFVVLNYINYRKTNE